MKIAKIINDCNDCEHCLSAKTNSTLIFAICTHTEDKEFVLVRSHENPKHFKLDIPANCPLEDYTGTKTI